jgi:hypothetical protein
MWIARITHKTEKQIETKFETATTLSSIWKKLYKFLNLEILEINIYRDEKI